MSADEVQSYYDSYDEQGRLTDRHSLERLRTQEIISRYLKSDKMKIADIGGAAGVYSFWLAEMGHRVDLFDLTPKHIEQAQERQKHSGITLNSAQVGDARNLPFADDTFDMVLLMGPLYHLQQPEDRLKVLREAKRIVKKSGKVFCAAISRYASFIDGFKHDLVLDPAFRPIMLADLENGCHINDTGLEKYFTTAFFHHPDELGKEISASGLKCEKMLAVEGIGSMIRDLDDKLKDESYKELLLDCLRKTESETSLLGASLHLLAVAGS